MAEETLPLDPLGTKSLMEANLSLSDVTPYIKDLPAKPLPIESINIPGNPITGPYAKQPEDATPVSSLFNSYQPKANPYLALKPYTYGADYDNANFERYYSTGDLYNKLGFSPYRDNDALYNKNMTLGDEFVRAAKQWDNLVGAGFMSGIKSWKTMFTDPLAPDLDAARDMARATAIGSSTKDGIGSFFVNTFLNSGYTIGIGADFLAEEVALAGITAFTGGLAGEVTVPAMVEKGASVVKKLFDFNKLTDKVGKGAKVLDVAADVNRFDGLNAINGIDDARTFWNTVGQGAKKIAAGTADILNPFDNTVAALMAKDYATDYAKISRTFGAFADDIVMLKGAVSEAKMEGGMAKIDITKDLIDNYKAANNGQDPDQDKLTEIDRIATAKAKEVAFWNLPAIATSNKLMYATMLAPLNKIMGTVTTKVADDVVFDNKVFREVSDNIFDKAVVASKSLAKPKFYGDFAMNYLKANLAEGFQENIQEAISRGAAEHAAALFKDPIRGAYEGYMPYFMKGLKEQASAQGFETFAGGFAMGMFAQPIMGGAGITVGKILNATVNKENYKALEEARRRERNGYVDERTGKQVKGKIQYLNELLQDSLLHLSPDLENAIRTGKLSSDMFTAARVGKKKEALDSRQAIQNHHILTAIRTGKLDIILNELKEKTKLQGKELVEAFEKYGVKEEDVDKVVPLIDGIISRAKTLERDYNDAANKYPNPYNPSIYRNDLGQFLAATSAKKAWDEAVYNLVFAKATFESNSKRIADIGKTFSTISDELAGADAQGMMTLLSSGSVVNEINMLRNEIKVISEDNKEQKKVKQDKQNKLEKLGQFYDSLINAKAAKTEDEKLKAEEDSKAAFMNYVKYLAGKNGNVVFDSNIENAYQMVKDHMLLKDDNAGLAESINILMTPKSFLNFQKRLFTAYKDLLSSREDILAMNNDEFEKRTGVITLLNKVKDTGLIIPQDTVAAIWDAQQNNTEIPLPEYFLDSNGNQITSGPQYEQAMRMLDAYKDIFKKAATTEETIKERYDENDISTYPKDLLDVLENVYLENHKFSPDSIYGLKKNDGTPLSKDEYASLSSQEQEAYEKQSKLNFERYVLESPQAKVWKKQYFNELKESQTEVPEKYRNLTLDQLKEEEAKLLEQISVNSALEKDLMIVKDQIAIKTMQAKTPEQERAIKAVLNLSDKIELTEDETGYTKDGTKSDYRVTSLAQEILEKEYGAPSFKNFTDRDTVAAVMEFAKLYIEGGKAANQSVESALKAWYEKAKSLSIGYKQKLSDRIDPGKLKRIINAMKTLDYNKFKELLDKQAYEESTTAGNIIDDLVRTFFAGRKMVKPEDMSPEAFSSLRKALHDLMKQVHKNEDVIIANNLKLFGEGIVDGKKVKIAGAMDLVAITPKGEIKIYDLKTSKSWDNYGTKEDDFKTKEKYALQLSLYKNLLENATGIKVDTNMLRIVPLEISVAVNGDINSIKPLFTDPKNTNVEFQEIANKYIPVTAKQVTPAVTPQEAAKEAAKPEGFVKRELTPQEQKTREGNIKTINSRIEKLKESKKTKEAAVTTLEETIDYLDNLLNNTIDLTNINLKELQSEIDVLLSVVNSNSKAQTKKGIMALEKLSDLKKTYRSEFQLLNDIVDRIKDLKEELAQQEAIRDDLNNQINYYNNLIADPTLSLLNKDELNKKKAVIQGKVNTLAKLINNLKEAINKTIAYLRTAVDSLFKAESNLKKFVDKNQYSELPKEEINRLMKSDLESDKVFLESYPALKSRFEELEDVFMENLDHVEFLDQVKEDETQRQEQLVNALNKYQDQIRYLDELMTPLNNNIKAEKIPGKTITDQGILYEEMMSPPVVKADKVIKQSEVNNKIKKAENKKKQKEDLAEGKVISTLTFNLPTEEVTEKKEVPTPEELNQNLNREAIDIAKKNKYEIIYDNKTWKVRRLNKNSVVLYAPQRDEVTIKNEDIPQLLKVASPIKDFTSADNDTVKRNANNLETSSVSFTDVVKVDATGKVFIEPADLKKLERNMLNSLCK